MRGPNPFKRFNKLGTVTVPFGGQTTQEQFHPAVDIANVKGTPIHAPVNGVVIKTEGGHTTGDNSFGNTVELKDIAGDTHQFHHLQNINVKPGQRVNTGQQIATLGNTGAVYSKSGRGDGSNLDYRIVTTYGRYKNPLTYVRNL